MSSTAVTTLFAPVARSQAALARMAAGWASCRYHWSANRLSLGSARLAQAVGHRIFHIGLSREAPRQHLGAEAAGAPPAWPGPARRGARGPGRHARRGGGCSRRRAPGAVRSWIPELHDHPLLPGAAVTPKLVPKMASAHSRWAILINVLVWGPEPVDGNAANPRVGGESRGEGVAAIRVAGSAVEAVGMGSVRRHRGAVVDRRAGAIHQRGEQCRFGPVGGAGEPRSSPPGAQARPRAGWHRPTTTACNCTAAMGSQLAAGDGPPWDDSFRL